MIRPGNQDLVRPKVIELRSIAGGRTIRFRLSEKARVRITFQRGRNGRKPHGGRCTTTRRIGRFCILWNSEGVLAPKPFSLKRAFNLKSTFVSDPRHRLPAGRIRATLVATDAAGNRSKPATIVFQLPR